ncbi:hypothetical protein NXS19_003923 [Fusarium pseudograminearum]|nr:hypothetical protein NXS19_003923 [Fusarium pseudograminearum]
MGQSQSNEWVKVPDLENSADNTKPTENNKSTENTNPTDVLKRLESITEHMIVIDELVAKISGPVMEGVCRFRKVRDEMGSLVNEDNASQKHQKQVEMLEVAIVTHRKMVITAHWLNRVLSNLSTDMSNSKFYLDK